MRCVNGKGVGGSVRETSGQTPTRESGSPNRHTVPEGGAVACARAGARGMDRREPSRHVRTTKRSASVFPSPLAFGGAPQQHHMILARASRLGRRTILRGSERRDGSRAANATLARPYPRARDRRTTPGATFARAFRRDAPSPVTRSARRPPSRPRGPRRQLARLGRTQEKCRFDERWRVRARREKLKI